MTQAFPLAAPVPADPWRRAAAELLAAWRSGHAGTLEAALENAARAALRQPRCDAGGEERRELLEGIVVEMRRIPPRPGPEHEFWSRILHHLAAGPHPSPPFLM